MHVNQLQMYPLPTGVADDAQPPPPFALLPGEGVIHSGHSVYGGLALTNYRLFLQLCDTQHHIPIGLLEAVEQRDLFFLHVGCKDARTYRLTFDNNETCTEWFGRLTKAAAPPAHLEELFAFYYFVWSKQERPQGEIQLRVEAQRATAYDERTFQAEVDRLKFNLHGTWRISGANRNYKLCASYPPQLLVPAYISDEVLETVAKFRSSRRIPAVVWRHVGNGAVIARCSQPEVGWLGWRSSEDEDLIKAISEACTQDRGPHALYVSHSPPSVSSNNDESTHIKSTECADDVEKKKVLIMDARSYTTAVANRARGGGCECPEYYPRCEIQFMNLANIHSIRKSFHALRQLCTSSADQPNWFGLLEGTRWLQHMSGLMKSAVVLVTAIERDARPVLVHCSDGWDRTPQIVALAELLLDPYYRTVDGFRILIEREWLAFGHKFADRCGHTTGSEDPNERCPVFLQWLDCVHQLLTQFPCAFEFSHTYLVKLAQHTYSNLYGTFLCNTKQERESFYETTFSVWQFLERPTFRNHLYTTPAPGARVLWPQCNVRDLRHWTEIYLGSLETQAGGSNTAEVPTANGGVASGTSSCPSSMGGTSATDASGAQQQHMTKTRSYGDLPHASDPPGTHVRRCSDPNIIVDSIKIASLSLNGTQEVGGVSDGMMRSATPTNFDDSDCKSDCIYKNDVNGGSKDFEDDDVDDATTTAAAVTAVSVAGNVILNAKTDEDCECDAPTLCARCASRPDMLFSVNLSTPEDALTPDTTDSPRGVQLNGLVGVGDDSDTEECTRSDSRSENVTVFTNLISTRLVDDKSVETSTETLVSENVCSSSSKEFNGFEKLTPVQNEPAPRIHTSFKEKEREKHKNNGGDQQQQDVCRACAQKWVAANGHAHLRHSHTPGGGNEEVSAASGRGSNYSTPPQYSRTPSANGWDSTFLYCNNSPPKHQCAATLDDDGLVPLKSDVQERLWHIIDEHRRKVEALQRELHTYRKALIKQVCHKCNHNENDRNDETNSVVESVCSAGEGQASAVESLRSDMSWEAVDENGPLVDGAVPPHTTLWVPDHAVTSCTGCNTVFWLGRRKHHCRNCGNIFCADCSENSTPLPSEHLYDPVRVCTSCFSKLSRHAFNSAASTPEEEVQDALLVAAMPLANAQHRVHHHHHPHLHHAPPPPHEQCKTHADRSAATTTNPRQITASSN